MSASDSSNSSKEEQAKARSKAKPSAKKGDTSESSSRTAISEITGQAFGSSSPLPAEESPSLGETAVTAPPSETAVTAPPSEAAFTDPPSETPTPRKGSGGSPLFQRVVSGYLAMNPQAKPADGMPEAPPQIPEAKPEPLPDKPQVDYSALIASLKRAPYGPLRNAACLKATENAHREGRLIGLEIVGVDDKRNALILKDQEYKQIVLVDKHDNTIEVTEY